RPRVPDLSARPNRRGCKRSGPGDPRAARLHDRRAPRADRAGGRMEESDRDAGALITMRAIDTVDLEVGKASLSAIGQEMQNSLFGTGFPSIVRESQDASCALMNARGEVVAQHVVLPLHIGAFPASTAAVIDAFGGGIAPGDAFVINHPYQGGSPHAPDIAV